MIVRWWIHFFFTGASLCRCITFPGHLLTSKEGETAPDGHSKRSQSEVMRSLIERGTVRERITKENLDIIRKLIGESTNLNQLARRANAYGFYRVADECSTAVQQIHLRFLSCGR